MKTIHLLLASSDRRLNNLVEVAVLDVCYDQAAVKCYRTARLHDFTVRGCCEGHDLIVVAPEHMQPGPARKPLRDPIEETVRAIQKIKQHRQVPVLAVGVSSEHELKLLMAGADNVFGGLFNENVFKAEIQRVLNLQVRAEEPVEVPSQRSSFAETLMRGLDRVRQAVVTDR